MKKNEEILLDIADLSEDGAGIGKYNGFVFFVPGALPGDSIRAGITKLKKTFGYARLLEVIRPSENRVESACSVSARCGGCSIMSLSYEEQLRIKEKKVADALVRIGGFDQDEIQKAMTPILGMDKPLRYRNKAQYPVGRDRQGNIVTGFFAPFSHRIIPCEDCMISHPEDVEILSIIRDWMEGYGIDPYDEVSAKGLVRHVLIRYAEGTGEIMVCLVINGAYNSLPREFWSDLIWRLSVISGISSISININRKWGNVILGDISRSIFGGAYINDVLGLDGPKGHVDLKFRISPASFYQVNTTQMKRLYEKVLEYGEFTGTETVWDLYCGIGTITLSMASLAGRVIGVDYSRAAIDDAIFNAAENGIENAEFYCGESETEAANLDRPDIVVVDPPRKGCDITLLDRIKTLGPKRIVYVSCNPSTLARDLAILCEGDYSIKAVTPVDQFCHSMHVETVVLITRKDK